MLKKRFWIENIDLYIDESCIHTKKNDTCIIILNYNNKQNILKLSEILTKVQNSDILIVDNSSSDGSYEILLEKYGSSFNLVKTKRNYGGAGGFGIGIQWVIEQDYDFCFVSEEDALPIKGHEDIFEEMLRYRDQNTFVVAKYYELDTISYTLHFHIYPIWLLKNVGTLNFDLFFRADDWEWDRRIQRCIESNDFKIEMKVIDRYYTHPLVKYGFGLFANYFGIRNSFFVFLEYPSRNFLIDYIDNFTKYFAYSIFSLAHDNNPQPLIQHH